MVKQVKLDDRFIDVTHYEATVEKELQHVSFHFKVTHEEYHEITTLLYKGVFNVEIPEQSLSFRGKIQTYATSITNLYQPGAVGDYYLSLIETNS